MLFVSPPGLRGLHRRFGLQGPDIRFFSPGEATSMQGTPGPNPLSDSDAEAIVKARDQVDKACLVQCILCASNHFVYMHGKRPTTKHQWEIMYHDPLPEQLPGCRLAAKNVLTYLGILPADTPLPESTPGLQRDGWSCGLWTIQEQEHQLRKFLHEPVTTKIPFGQVLHRLNDFISRVSPAAKAAMPVARSVRRMPSTMAEAIEASWACAKCHVTKSTGQKGCTQCMGSFFTPVRAGSVKKEIGAWFVFACMVCVLLRRKKSVAVEENVFNVLVFEGNDICKV